MRRLIWASTGLCILAAGAFAWQNDDPPPAIQKDGVVNAASEMPPMFGGGALAPGSVVRIRGWRLGPAEKVSSTSTPLPARLEGMAVEIRQKETRVTAELLSVSGNVIEAILPENAPLGDAQLIVLRDDAASDPFPVRIVKAAFGASVDPAQGWGQEGLVHNGWPTKDAAQNTLSTSARPGQTVTLRGTGLGAVPIAMAGLTIHVGGKPVKTIRYAGRSACCAGFDELAFDLPVDAPEGCHVPIQVRTGPGIASNFVTLAVQRDGAKCSDPGDWVSPRTAASKRAGLIVLHHSDMLFSLESAGTMRYRVDAGFAKFVADPSPQITTGKLLGFPPPGTCTAVERLTKLRGMMSTTSPLDAIEGLPIDAGSKLTVEGNGGRRTIGHPRDSPSSFSAVLGGNAPIPSAAEAPLFLKPGPYRVSALGEGTGEVHADITVGGSIEWSNRSSISRVDRSKGVTIRWKPGQRDDLVLLSAANIDNDSGTLGMAVCVAEASAGRFTIPPAALTNIPATLGGDHLPLNLLWVIEVPGHAPPPFAAGLLDHTVAFFTSSSVRTVEYR